MRKMTNESLGAVHTGSLKENKKKNIKGITLVALIITIIVLLILSGVAIATLTGENGLFARAKQAKQTQTESEMKEKLNLSIQELQVEKLTEATLDDITQEWLTQKLSEYNPILKENETAEGKKVTLQKNGIIKTYLIDIKLNITEIENKSGIEFSYEIVKRENGKVKILIKVQDSENGINKVEVPGDAIILNGTREQRGIDQEIEVGTEYTYKVISVSGKEREETILIEPEIIVGEAYIGISRTEADSTKSVLDNSQTKGTKLYINFTATLEKFGTSACTVKLKDGTDSDTLPYAITKNGTYTFVVTGTYGEGKIITKEIEVKVNKYQAAKNLVKYDAGDWTENEIDELDDKKLYDYNESNTVNGKFKLNDDSGLNFTFGGFKVGNSRNNSVRSGGGTATYDGWQLLKTETKTDENGNIIKNEDGKDRIYVTKIVHAGSSENFVCAYTAGYDMYRAEYLLSNGKSTSSYLLNTEGTIKDEFKVLNDGKTTINTRNWDMYKDKILDKKGYIKEVHLMTYKEASNITENNRNIGSYYWLENVNTTSYYESTLWIINNKGQLHTTSGVTACWGIRPVVEMNDGVYIASGSGTESDPYVLGKD